MKIEDLPVPPETHRARARRFAGRVTAEGAGSTRIIGVDRGRHGIGPVEIPVTVEP